MDNASQAAVRVEQLDWWRGDQHILKNINWQVNTGEHWAILGLNGSGKTTLLQMVAGYLWPSKGNLTVLGNRYGECDLREVRKAIGWVSSVLEERLNPGETVRDIVISGKFATFGLYEKWGENEIEKAEQILGWLGCQQLSGHRFGRLSQGEKQKVIIARALMAEPQLLILDEPCNGLDLFAREHLLQTISQLAKQEGGPTLLYVTHHIEEILPVFHFVLLMADGTIHALGKKEAVLSDHNLTKAYRIPVHVEWREGRPWPQILRRT